MKRFSLYILLITATLAAIVYALPPSTPDDGTLLQKQLDAGWHNFVPNGSTAAPVGTTVNVSGTIKLARPLKLGTLTALIGRGATQTIIEFDGGPGTSAILLGTGNPDTGVCYEPLVSDLTIYTPNGADAIGIDPSAKVTEGVTCRNVVFYGGGVNYAGENYFPLLDNCRFIQSTGRCIRFDGSGAMVIRDTRIQGPVAKNFKVPATGLIEIHGDCTFEGTSRLESNAPCAQLWCSSRPRGFAGFVHFGATSMESHRPDNGPGVILDNTTFVTDWAGNNVHPWQKTANTKLVTSSTVGVVTERVN